jgi:two-component system cell cycle sensor histidine kinase/response regulator CckA
VERARSALEALGYVVLGAKDGEAALALYRQHHGRIDLIISDLVMPRLSGRGLFDEIRGTGRATPFLLATAMPPGDQRAASAAGMDVPVIRKPWSVAELARSVRHALQEVAA